MHKVESFVGWRVGGQYFENQDDATIHSGRQMLLDRAPTINLVESQVDAILADIENNPNAWKDIFERLLVRTFPRPSSEIPAPPREKR